MRGLLKIAIAAMALARLAGGALLARRERYALPRRIGTQQHAVPASVRRLPFGWYFGIGTLLLVVGASVAWRVSTTKQEESVARALTGGEPARGPDLMIRFGCAGCHNIPGVAGADGLVGPNLAGLRKRVFIGGVARNTAGNLTAWIVDPPALSPKTAMPVTGISLPEARDVAAFLYSR
jgi:cytochrome c2